MSDFPEIQPFGPRPAPQNGDPSNEAGPASQSVRPADDPAQPASRRELNIGLILTAAAVGFALGYVVARYQEIIVRETRFNELVDGLQVWLREQGRRVSHF